MAGSGAGMSGLEADLERVRILREDLAARADAEYLVELGHRWRMRHGEFRPTKCGECAAVLATVEIIAEMNSSVEPVTEEKSADG